MLNIQHTGAVEGAKDLYLKYDNLPAERLYFFTVKAAPYTIYNAGDVAVWGETKSNKYGHVAIVLSEFSDGFIVFEQDGFKQDGAKLNFRSRNNLLGVLRPFANV